MLIGPDIRGITIEKDGHVEMSNVTIEMTIPRQMCYVCSKMFDAYMVDDDKWDQMPVELQSKYVCPECFRKKVKRK